MKKKIILLLSVLLVALFLTGCAQEITVEEIKKLNEVANEIAANNPDYKLPEGYDMSLPDPKDPSRIMITSTTADENTIDAYYELSEGKADLEKTVTDDGSELLTFYVGFVCWAIGVLMTLVIMSS